MPASVIGPNPATANPVVHVPGRVVIRDEAAKRRPHPRSVNRPRSV